MYTNKHGKPQMKITTPNGILEGESIEAILEKIRTRLPTRCRPA